MTRIRILEPTPVGLVYANAGEIILAADHTAAHLVKIKRAVLVEDAPPEPPAHARHEDVKEEDRPSRLDKMLRRRAVR